MLDRDDVNAMARSADDLPTRYGFVGQGAVTGPRGAPDADHGKVASAMNGMSRLFSILALLFGGMVGTLLGPRPTFMVAGAAGAVVVASAALLLHRNKRHSSRRPAAGPHAWLVAERRSEPLGDDVEPNVAPQGWIRDCEVVDGAGKTAGVVPEATKPALQ
jgi:hypothetical protein